MDQVVWRIQSPYIRILVHLEGYQLDDAQMETLIVSKTIPLLTRYLQSHVKEWKRDSVQRVVFDISLSRNKLSGRGVVPLLKWIHTNDFRISTLGLHANRLSDSGMAKMCNVFRVLKYPPNELHFANNNLGNEGFKCIMDFIAARKQTRNILSYPVGPYSVKFGVLLQNRVPLWLRLEHNSDIDIQATAEYMQKVGITVCYAQNWKNKARDLDAERGGGGASITKTPSYCTAQCCIPEENASHYQRALEKYAKKVEEFERKSGRCRKCKDRRKATENGRASCNECWKLRQSIGRGTKAHRTSDYLQDALCGLPQQFEMPMLHLPGYLYEEPVNNFNVDAARQLIGKSLGKKSTSFLAESVAGSVNEERNHEKNEERERRKRKLLDEQHTAFTSVEASTTTAKSSTAPSGSHSFSGRGSAVVKQSVSPLFIMVDTCGLVKMVALPKRQSENLWECMISRREKSEYIEYFATRYYILKNRWYSSCDEYQRSIRMEIMSQMHMSIQPDLVRLIADALNAKDFATLSTKKSWKMLRKYKDSAFEQNLIRCHTYHYIGRHHAELPGYDAPSHEWQPLVEEIFTGLGFECPQGLIPKFESALKKLGKQYAVEASREGSNTFTINTLVDKAKQKLFGRCFADQRDHAMLLIPHTVQTEMEHLKNSLRHRQTGEFWRVQQLCGPNGLLDRLCREDACDLMSLGEGEAHLESAVQNAGAVGANDVKIMEVAQRYSTMLNKGHNLGMILLTLDKTMYTIASGKGIPVLNLQQFNTVLATEQRKNESEEETAWTGTYLRQRFMECGFVGGVATKSMLKDATKLLQQNKVTAPKQKGNAPLNRNAPSTGNGSDSKGAHNGYFAKSHALSNEVEYLHSRTTVARTPSHDSATGSGTGSASLGDDDTDRVYSNELLQSMSLTNDLMSLCRELICNREPAPMMREVYRSKLSVVETVVRQRQKVWGTLVQESMADNKQSTSEPEQSEVDDSHDIEDEDEHEDEDENGDEKEDRCALNPDDLPISSSSKEHLKYLIGSDWPRKCKLCNAEIHDWSMFEQHIRGKKHMRKVMKLKGKESKPLKKKKSDSKSENDDGWKWDGNTTPVQKTENDGGWTWNCSSDPDAVPSTKREIKSAEPAVGPNDGAKWEWRGSTGTDTELDAKAERMGNVLANENGKQEKERKRKDKMEATVGEENGVMEGDEVKWSWRGATDPVVDDEEKQEKKGKSAAKGKRKMAKASKEEMRQTPPRKGASKKVTRKKVKALKRELKGIGPDVVLRVDGLLKDKSMTAHQQLEVLESLSRELAATNGGFENGVSDKREKDEDLKSKECVSSDEDSCDVPPPLGTAEILAMRTQREKENEKRSRKQQREQSGFSWSWNSGNADKAESEDIGGFASFPATDTQHIAHSFKLNSVIVDKQQDDAESQSESESPPPLSVKEMEAMQSRKKSGTEHSGFKWSFNGNNGSEEIGGFQSLFSTDSSRKKNGFKLNAKADDDVESDSDSPPPLDAEDQQKLMAMKRNIRREDSKQSSWSWSIS